jgi:hypothetical protein
MNRFSGLVSVTSAESTGQMFLVEGEVVHAEANGAAGEAAVRVIVGWEDGAFELYPNTTTLHRTIQKSLSHLLLDAHRQLDERRRGAPVVRPPPPSTTPSLRQAQGELGATALGTGPAAAPPRQAAPATRDAAPRPNLFDQIRGMRGVTRLVRFVADGRPLGAEGLEAEQLAAKGIYLAMSHAAPVAAAFGLHELGIATLQGAQEAFVLVHASGNYLCIAVAPEVSAEAVAAQIRVLLARPATR